jgi:poly-beta-1,6-N-acetyl-D-glucosamine synthase
MTGHLSYVIITPARNEVEFIELTLKSVVAQTIPPLKWVIVSDGSTDGTDDIVSRYAALYPWIELLRVPERKERHFAGKVMAFNAGYARMQDVQYDVIVSLDADISLPASDYFEFLLEKLADDSALGLVGTPFEENSIAYDYRIVGMEHVSGACQVFRRQCFEAIGGYVPVKGGGIDHVAVTSARMKGWKTRTFTEEVCVHHRAMGTAEHGALMARFRSGVKDYAYGGHPVWELFRTVYQMSRRPYIIGGLFLGAGYVWAMVRRAQRPISREMVAFRRRDQMRRLRRILTETLSKALPKLSWQRPERTTPAEGGGSPISTRRSAGRS